MPAELRLVKIKSDVLALDGHVAVIDGEGVMIGRDRSYTAMIRLAALAVSKQHANIFVDDAQRGSYAVSDLGSTQGTWLKSAGHLQYERLSAPRQASAPVRLAHGDSLRIAETIFVVHSHPAQRVCAECSASDAKGNSREIGLSHLPAESSKVASPPLQTVGRNDADSAVKHDLQSLRRQYARPDPHSKRNGTDVYIDRAAKRRRQQGTGSVATPATKGSSKPSHRDIEDSGAVIAAVRPRTAARVPMLQMDKPTLDRMPAAASPQALVRAVQGRAGLGSRPLLSIEEVASSHS